ncbi:hypothetical protein CEXT_50331 [Caerostris extrusa]|uniref:Uncharacterized protein n=1 Tax=Caerostris extrusa TaxID=172846 RepID=A0AAV4WYL9_CAEEX|nr:hypothetical protein CEXT_50331 [Caerostris extrusa]
MSGVPPTAWRIMISSPQVLPVSSWTCPSQRSAPCMVHPSVFLNRCPLLTTRGRPTRVFFPAFICIELNRDRPAENELRPSFIRVRLIKTFEVFSKPFPVTAPYGDQRQNELEIQNCE